jgi:thioredoxin 1
MKYTSLILFAALFFSACSSNGGNPVLDAKTFSEKLKSTQNSVLLDVRTEEEFAKEYIEGALLADWNSDDFQRRIDAIDKNAPVFVYCLSGGRSSSAAAAMRKQGFKEVFELQGGIMKWKSAGLPVVSGKVNSNGGMSSEEYKNLISGGNVLVDFSAEWCAPCRKMKPSLEELAKENPSLKIVNIDVDQNPNIAAELGVDALPTLKYYSNSEMKFTNVGFLSKDDLKLKLGL